MEVRLLVRRTLRSAQAVWLLSAAHGVTAAPAAAQNDEETPVGVVDALASVPLGPADEEASPPPPPGWTNETELSLVLAGGNSTARTFGFGDTLRFVGESSRLQIRANGLRSGTAAKRFLRLDSGLRFPVGGRPEDTETRLVRPSIDTKVENYLVSGYYAVELGERFFWNAGGSWDRNSDAGILDRYIAFAGVGNVWSDSPAVRFATSYAANYTDRREAHETPGKAPRFAGARLAWNYRQRMGAATVYENELAANVNLTAASDYSFNMTHALRVALSKHLALRVALQWLYEHQPVPEETAVVVHAELIDPDGEPGSGDEFFETVADEDIAITLGTLRVQRERLDTVFRTALVISF